MRIRLVEVTEGTNEEYYEIFDARYRELMPQLPMINRDMDRMAERDIGVKPEIIKSDSGNVFVKFIEGEDKILLLGIISKTGKMTKEDIPDMIEMYDILIEKINNGKDVYTSGNNNSMKLIKGLIRRAKQNKINLKYDEEGEIAFGDIDELKFKNIHIYKA